jgi:hypothetical protein
VTSRSTTMHRLHGSGARHIGHHGVRLTRGTGTGGVDGAPGHTTDPKRLTMSNDIRTIRRLEGMFERLTQSTSGRLCLGGCKNPEMPR